MQRLGSSSGAPLLSKGQNQGSRTKAAGLSGQCCKHCTLRQRCTQGALLTVYLQRVSILFPPLSPEVSVVGGKSKEVEMKTKNEV